MLKLNLGSKLELKPRVVKTSVTRVVVVIGIGHIINFRIRVD